MQELYKWVNIYSLSWMGVAVISESVAATTNNIHCCLSILYS